MIYCSTWTTTTHRYTDRVTVPRPFYTTPNRGNPYRPAKTNDPYRPVQTKYPSTGEPIAWDKYSDTHAIFCSKLFFLDGSNQRKFLKLLRTIIKFILNYSNKNNTCYFWMQLKIRSSRIIVITSVTVLSTTTVSTTSTPTTSTTSRGRSASSTKLHNSSFL